MTGSKNKQYLARARKLNRYLKAGIKHENGKNLTPAIKAKITREYNKHKEYLDDPQAFKSLRLTGDRLKQLKKNGYITSKSRVFIPKYDANNVQIRKNTIVHAYADKYTETLIGDQAEIIDNFESVFKSKHSNQFIGASFGGSGLFKTTTFDSYQTFLNYMSNFTPKDKKDASDKEKRETKEKLIAEMRLITIPRSWREKLDVGEKKKAVPLSKALNRFNK